MVVAYLVRAYHPHPGWVDGTYFPDGGFLFDLHTMWRAGHEVVLGQSPYPFIYPAPAVVFMAPFGALPWTLAVVAFSLTIMAGLVLALRLLGVRDWRCYAAAFAAMPVASSIMIGTLSPLLVLAAAAAWRYRDRRFVVATAIAAAVVTKIFLWPLAIWLVATRRFRTAVTTVVVGIALTIGSWGVIGFSGMLDYPHWLGRAAGMYEARSYSPLGLFEALGLSRGSARLGVALLALGALAAIVVAARGKDGDRRSFVVALGACLLLSPIVWLHYLVLVFVPIALYRTRLSAAWLVPFAYWLLPGQESGGSVANFAVMFGLTAAAVTLAIREPRERTPEPVLSTP
jgi:alpha-1,2-mannosyltransferase